jgi:predicted unusual protein kinase regulating ubiquinone biosynthesis (AarF/ABC1/UbiB family)
VALKEYVEHLLSGSIDQAYLSYEKLLLFSPNTDRRAFRVEVKAAMRSWLKMVLDPYGDPAERHVGRIADRKAALLYKYHVQLDANTLLFWRTLIVLDGTALRLWPEFDLAKTLGQFFRSLAPSVTDRVYQSLWNDRRIWGTANLIRQGPSAILSIDQLVNNGSFAVTRRAQPAPDQTGRRIKWLCLDAIALAVWIYVRQNTYHPLIWDGTLMSVVLISIWRAVRAGHAPERSS